MSVQSFVWYELATSDVAAARAFYGRVLGWTAREFADGAGYWIVSAEETGVGGIMQLPEGMSQPFWLGYIGTSDIDGAAEKFRAAGGTVRRLWDIPNVGRLALLSDPQGAGLAAIQSNSSEPSRAFDQMRNGHGNWNELHTNDAQAALTFYAGQFGWEEHAVLDMGPIGTYRIFAANGQQIGGMMNAMGGGSPMWLFYFGVPSIDASLPLITEAGGQVIHGPSEVPGGAWIAHARDPQGAMFAVVGRK